jgi:D-sedoheptulose 7-phosphate isomerase
MIDFFKNSIKDSIETKQLILSSNELLSKVENVINKAVETYRNGGKVLFCGNGGSAADAQHLAAELSGRYMYDRQPLASEALHVNTSFLTAVANDYSFDDVYARMISAIGKQGDILIGLSTSGNSANVVKAFQKAREIGITTVGFTGAAGGKMREVSDFLINVPSIETPRIQESHIMLGHILCEHIEATLFPR